jgi:hypothetical protein
VSIVQISILGSTFALHRFLPKNTGKSTIISDSILPQIKGCIVIDIGDADLAD